MKPGSDTEMPIAAASSTSDVEKDSIMNAFKAPHQSPFLWKNCENEEQRDRVDIKQQAFDIGLSWAEDIVNKLETWRNENSQAIENPEVTDLIKEFYAIKKKYRSYRGPVVGFRGVIGSGKTSLINALLGEEELLVTSSDRAATAVVCEVVYNHESSDYRAEVIYRTRESLAQQLDKMFRSLKWKADLELRKQTLEGSPDGDEQNYAEMQEIDDQISEIEDSISETLEIVPIIWGVLKDDLKDMSTQSLLDAQSYGAEFLGTAHPVSGIDRETFMDEISRYTTSTSEDKIGLGLPAWPLIKKVFIYVKSPVLEYGLRFRDLPGMDDAVEARSNIARENSKDLGITVVVAHAIRASDEKAGIGLIEEQNLRVTEMKMNGQLNRDSFCVVVSKTDDIKSEPYLKKVAKTNKSVANRLCRVRELDDTFHRAGSRKRKFQDQNPGQNSFIPNNNAELVENRREAAVIKEWLEQTAISMRNQEITERIQHKFQKCYGDNDLNQNAELHSEAVEVFGVSSKAYWMSRHPDGEKARGFPHENHSGIPRLKQWLFEITFTHREKHLLDPMLEKLFNLLLNIQNWTGSELSNAQDATETDGQAVQRIHKHHLAELTNVLKDCGEDLSRVDPLKDKETALTECRRQCVDIVKGWKNNPPGHRKTQKWINHKVQSCILHLEGEGYGTHARYGTVLLYHWLDDLIKPFFDVTFQSWERAFQEIVPAHEKKIMKSTEPQWQRYGTALARLSRRGPAGTLKNIVPVQVAIHSGKNEMKHRARALLKNLTEKAEEIHPVFRQEIKDILIPVFQEALAIRGLGSKKKREKLLQDFAEDHSATIAIKSVSLVEKQFRSHFGAHKAAAGSAAQNTILQLQEENKHSLASWVACWEKPPSPRENYVMRGDLSIPEPEPIEVEDGA